MIVNVVSQAHRSAVAPRGPKSGPRCSRDSACGLIPMLLSNGSHAYQIDPTTPPPGQGLLRFAKSTPTRSPTDSPCDVEIIDSRCRGERMKNGTSRWIGLDRATHDTRVLGPSFNPAGPTLSAAALATILHAFDFTMEESPN